MFHQFDLLKPKPQLAVFTRSFQRLLIKLSYVNTVVLQIEIHVPMVISKYLFEIGGKQKLGKSTGRNAFLPQLGHQSEREYKNKNKIHKRN